MKTIIISLGGSLIVPCNIDMKFLKKFRSIVLDYVKEGNKVALMCGGGKTAREYIKEANKVKKLSNHNNDMIGIIATRLNAELVRAIFSEYAYEKVVYNPNKKINTRKRIIVGAGYLPGCSTDKDAVLIAKALKAKTVINLTNVDYVYDKNPKKYKNAKPIKEITWNNFLKITGTKWKAGLNLPFDPLAAVEAKKSGVRVIIANGNNLDNLKKIISGKKFKGSVIK